jgi:hypothetical protein
MEADHENDDSNNIHSKAGFGLKGEKEVNESLSVF